MFDKTRDKTARKIQTSGIPLYVLKEMELTYAVSYHEYIGQNVTPFDLLLDIAPLSIMHL